MSTPQETISNHNVFFIMSRTGLAFSICFACFILSSAHNIENLNLNTLRCLFCCSCTIVGLYILAMGLLPGTKNCGLRMRRECQERVRRHRLQREPLFSDPGMHHGTCVARVPWCMSGWLTCGGREDVPGIPGPPFYVSGKRPMADPAGFAWCLFPNME